MLPRMAGSSKLPGSADEKDTLDGMDVATGVAMTDRRRHGYDRHVTSAEIIEEIRVRISRAAPPESRVILFGSRARGEADDGSDFDVLVIEPEVEDSAGEAVRLRRELRDVLAPIDVVVVDRDLARRRAAVRGTMVERALREGRVLADT